MSYDQSLLVNDATRRAREAEERAMFFESSAKRWRAAYDYLVSALDRDDPETAEVVECAERVRDGIPLICDASQLKRPAPVPSEQER